MVLVLFFLGIIGLIALLIILTSVLSLQIDIKNFKLYKEEKVEKKSNDDYEIFIYLYIFRKIKIFRYKINNKKIYEKYYTNMKNKIDIKKLKSFITKNYNVSNVKFIEIESLNLNLKLGTENVMLTSGIVTLSNVLISIVLSKLIKEYHNEKYKYEIRPIYENKNKIDLFLESKIRIKLFSIAKALKSYDKVKRVPALK